MFCRIGGSSVLGLRLSVLCRSCKRLVAVKEISESDVGLQQGSADAFRQFDHWRVEVAYPVELQVGIGKSFLKRDTFKGTNQGGLQTFGMELGHNANTNEQMRS